MLNNLVPFVCIAGIAVAVYSPVISTLFATQHVTSPPYTLQYDPKSRFLGVPDYEVIDVGGLKLKQLVGSDDSIRSAPGFHDPAPPPPMSSRKLPYALIEASYLRRVEGTADFGTPSDRVYIAPTEILSCPQVPAWRVAVHPWKIRDSDDSPAFRMLDFYALELRDGQFRKARHVVCD